MKALTAALAALVILAVFPVTASAAVYQYGQTEGSCTQLWHDHGDTVPFLCATEAGSHTGRRLILTGSSDLYDLRNVQHGGAGLCQPKSIDDDNWNDCITSAWVKLGTNDSFCFHGDASYSGSLVWWAAAPASPSGGVWTYSTGQFSPNDTVSSIRLQQSGTDCNDL